MTQSPRSGEAAPVDTPGGRHGSDGGQPGNGLWSAGNGGAPGAELGRLPRPDTPTDTVPAVTDGPAPQHGAAAAGSAGSPAPGHDAGPLTAAGLGGAEPPQQPHGTPGQHSAPSGSAAGQPRRARARGPRRAQLQLRHFNPWTVLKFSCVLAIALFFVWLIVVGVLYGILDATGVIHRINDAYTTLKSDGSGAPITAGVVFGSAAIVGLIDIVLFIALSTIGSVVYNLCADLVGGIEVTLSER